MLGGCLISYFWLAAVEVVVVDLFCVYCFVFVGWVCCLLGDDCFVLAVVRLVCCVGFCGLALDCVYC